MKIFFLAKLKQKQVSFDFTSFDWELWPLRCKHWLHLSFEHQTSFGQVHLLLRLGTRLLLDKFISCFRLNIFSLFVQDWYTYFVWPYSLFPSYLPNSQSIISHHASIPRTKSPSETNLLQASIGQNLSSTSSIHKEKSLLLISFDLGGKGLFFGLL